MNNIYDIQKAYATLGLSPGASVNDIKSSFRKLSVQYHPDRNPNGENKYKQITEAYQLIKDAPTIKLNYNQYTYNSESIEAILSEYIKYAKEREECYERIIKQRKKSSIIEDTVIYIVLAISIYIFFTLIKFILTSF